MAARAARAPEPRPDGAPVERASGDALAMSRLSDVLLPALIARFEASGLGELEVRRGEWRIRLSRSLEGVVVGGTDRGSRAAAGVAPAERSGLPTSAAAARSAQMAAVGPGRASASSVAAGTGGPARRMASSPAVGYFLPLEAMTPGRAVRAGDLLGHVDVLGVRQEVVAPSDGSIGRVLAEPGQAVEYGQELVRLEAAPRVVETKPAAESSSALQAPVPEG